MTFPRLVAWSKLLAIVLALAIAVIVPFLIWGEQMDSRAPTLLHHQATRWAVAAIGMGLLVADVLLPVPSSIVAVSLCLLLGLPWGPLAVFAGMTGAFVTGYLLGHFLPSTRLRRWVGPRTWDALASRHRTSSLWWIALSRPIPVLAEVTAVFAGSLHLPFLPSLMAASVSAYLVAIAYGLAAWVELQHVSASLALVVLAAVLLPAAGWMSFQWIRRRWRLE